LIQKNFKERELLINTALGKTPADTIVQNGKIVDVYTGHIYKSNIAIKGKRIALVGDTKHTLGKNTKIIDAKNYFLAPGLIDPHTHVTSSMVTICELANAIIPLGVTGLVVQVLDIPSSWGEKGIELLIEDGEKSLLKAFICSPGPQPDAPKLVTTGGKIGPKEIDRFLRLPQIIAQTEVMPIHVLSMRPSYKAAFLAATRSRKRIGGHIYGLSGKELNAFVAGGVQDCHSGFMDLAYEGLRLGLPTMLIGSFLDNVIGVITQKKVDSSHCMICTDGVLPNEIIKKHHLDYFVRKAISKGVGPVTAIQMVTINPAIHYGISHDVGSITPGRFADIIFLKNLKNFIVEKVMVDGNMVAEGGKMITRIPPFKYPPRALSTIKVRKKIDPSDLKIPAKLRVGSVSVRIIKIINFLDTKEIIEKLSIRNKEILADPDRDILKILVLERHQASGRVGKGFVSGFKLKTGAIASTHNYVADNIVSVGTNDQDISTAINQVIDMKGGLTAVDKGKIVGKVELPMAGIISPEPIGTVADKLENLERAVKDKLKCPVKFPFAQLATLTGLDFPELRITDKGLVRVIRPYSRQKEIGTNNVTVK